MDVAAVRDAEVGRPIQEAPGADVGIRLPLPTVRRRDAAKCPSTWRVRRDDDRESGAAGRSGGRVLHRRPQIRDAVEIAVKAHARETIRARSDAIDQELEEARASTVDADVRVARQLVRAGSTTVRPSTEARRSRSRRCVHRRLERAVDDGATAPSPCDGRAVFEAVATPREDWKIVGQSATTRPDAPVPPQPVG